METIVTIWANLIVSLPKFPSLALVTHTCTWHWSWVSIWLLHSRCKNPLTVLKWRCWCKNHSKRESGSNRIAWKHCTKLLHIDHPTNDANAWERLEDIDGTKVYKPWLSLLRTWNRLRNLVETPPAAALARGRTRAIYIKFQSHTWIREMREVLKANTDETQLNPEKLRREWHGIFIHRPDSCWHSNHKTPH